MIIIKKIKTGFTLIEILVAMSITIILTIIVNNFLITGFKTSTFNYEQEEAIEHARNAIDVVTREIRGANSSERGDYLLSKIEANDFVFYSDVDKDGIREKVRYYLEGKEFKRVITEPGTGNNYIGASVTSTLADYVNNTTSPIFNYYDSNRNITSVINNIRLINIFLKINVTPTRAPGDYLLESDIQLRNLKDNL
jgi:prepilin-type N-terminal cleavage/methylation domain-containing protein